jgi:dihydroorotate dehydrogenase
MGTELAVSFTGLRFENPFLLSSAPPTESEQNILRAYDAGWGGVVTKTIGLHPVVNVAGPRTKFFRVTPDSTQISMKKRSGAALHSSWNWELISDKTLDWWVPRIGRIKRAHPTRVLVTSIMAGSGSDAELSHWQTLARACQDEGADAIELNLSCPHMDRPDMGSNIGKDAELIAVVCRAVKEVARVPVWAKLTPSTTDIVTEARGVFLGGADAISSSNTFPWLRLERRSRWSRDPAFVAGEDRAADAGISRQVVLGHRRHRRIQSRAELLSPRLRHGPGVHRGDARSGCRPQRREAFAVRDERDDGPVRVEDARRLHRAAPRAYRGSLADPAAGGRELSRRL